MLFGLEPHVVAKISLEAPRRRFQDCRDFEVSLLIGQLPGSDLRQARIVRRKHRPRTSPVEGIVRTSLDPAGARRTRTHSPRSTKRVKLTCHLVHVVGCVICLSPSPTNPAVVARYVTDLVSVAHR